ncbi:MAG: alpha/beta fold hydrolase [Candidatus Heimdallarchaeota archaeon]|nr:alpha/beta fold hydrolase [Candidatus Heimdallarchaeota archaeon]
MRIIWHIIIGLLGLILIVLVVLSIAFRIWFIRKKNNLTKSSELAETAMGLVEYVLLGKGPIIVMCHGAPGGYDQGYLLEELIEKGYQVLCFSRPGYLQTPLKNQSIEDQVKLLNALLDELFIEEVIIAGFSAGGPIAISYAQNYPEKTKGLILEAALSREYIPPDKVEGTIWEKIFLNSKIQDFLGYLMKLSLKLMPFVTLNSIIQIETTLTKKERKEFINYVKSNPEELDWYKKLLESTIPLSIRNAGLQNDLELYKNLEPVKVDNITSPTLIIHSRQDNDAKWKHAKYLIDSIKHTEIMEVFGGHMMWIGPDADKIREKRTEFLQNL